METRRDVFQAIADPTRRQIIGLLARQPMNLNKITKNFEVSRPAISNHIRILQECGLIVIEQAGRERYCKIKPDQLKEIADWITQYRALWEQKLDSFETYLNQLQANNKNNGNSQ